MSSDNFRVFEIAGRSLFYGLLSLYIILLIVLGFLSLLALIRGNIDVAGTYAELIGGLGIVGLIVLTGWYAFHTRRMANQQWETHKEEIEDRRSRRQLEVNALRRALREEIGKIEYLDDLADDYKPGYSSLDPLVPKTIYQGNASQLGLLTEEEVDLVVEFYTRAEDVEKYMKVQRRMDLTPPTNVLSYTERLGAGLFNGIMKILSLGHFTPGYEHRAELIREKMESLADTQEKAIAELEDNLNE